MTDPTVPTYRNPFEFDMCLLEPVHSIMETGIRVDVELMDKLLEEKKAEWEKYQQHLDAIAGGELNVNSPKQMKEFFYGELGLPKRVKNGRPTTNEDALRAMMAECMAKIESLKTESAKMRWKRGAVGARLTLNIREVRKVISSYLDITIDDDKRCRSTISVGGTETGRFSHSKTLWDTGLNVATIPRKLRKIFIADEGKEMAELDLERGESWIYTHLSQDPELMRIHHDGLDFHSETAAAISVAFGDRLDADWIVAHKNDEAYKIRYLGKRINHASAYRMGPFQGAAVINKEADDTGITITPSQFKAARALWLEKYFRIERWWENIEKALDVDRTLTTPYGRTRQFHERWGDSLFKEATAYVPQSSSVDYLNRGMLRVFHLLQKRGAFGLQLLGQTHDSILIQYDEGRRDECLNEVAALLHDTLNIRGVEFTIPIEAGYGPSWGDQEEFELEAA